MKNPFVLIAMVAVCSAQLLWASPEAAAQPAQSGPGQYGTVHFPISCRSGVQEQFERAVAMLHSFFYPEDVKAFEAIIAADPDCAMAYWGLAISQRPNPLVPPWAAENLKRGLDAVQKGKALAKTERERDWLTALEEAYAGYDNIPTTTRSERYEQAMERLARKYPDDKEAAIFYALALLEAGPAQPSRTGALHCSRVRLRAAGGPGCGRRRQVCQGRSLGAARPAHALTHLFDPRAMGRLDSLEPGRGESLARVRGQECSRDDVLAGAARAGFHGVRVSAARPGS